MYAIANDTSFYLPLAETVAATWVHRHARLQQIAKGKGATDLEELQLLCELEDDEVWLKVGEPGMGAYIERVLGYDPKTGQERMRVARALRHLPAIAAALGTGELSYSAVKELTRVVDHETEKRWLAESLGKRLREIETMVSGREPGDLPEAPPRPENIPHFIRGEVSASTFAKSREARKRLEEELGHAIDEDTFFSMLFDGALAGGGASDRPRHQRAVTVCGHCKRGWQDGAGRAIELSAAEIALAECDSEHIGSLDAKTPTRASSDVPPATRRFVLHRDGFRCRRPGCRSSRHLDVHHIVHRSDDGGHDPDNLVTLCAEHHKALHQGKLKVERQANGELHFEQVEPIVSCATIAPNVVSTVLEALVGMGFRKHEARSLVDTAIAHVGDPTPATLLHEALRRCPSK